MQKAPYRNAIRSRRLIQNAYIQLMEQKDLIKIKTKEVIELADVSKGTFYAHYTCLYDVQQEIENERLIPMFRVFEESPRERILEDFSPLFLSGLKAMEEDRELFRILFRPSYGDSFLNKVKNQFLHYMMPSSDHCKDLAGLPYQRASLTYVAGGAIALIQDWLEHSPQIPAETVARILSDCTLNGIQGGKRS